VQGLLTGAVDYIVDGTATSLPLIQAGKLRALAKLNSPAAAGAAGGQAAAVEAGIPALDDVSTWIGFVAPAGTPARIVDKIQREVVKMYADPVIAEKLEKPASARRAVRRRISKPSCARNRAAGVRVFKDSGIQLN
jgi:tripartite-type tricarboxylate transporter receptor subunit TctC